MTRKRSLRTKRRNTRRHHGGRGGAGGVAGAGHYGSATTTGASQVLAQWTGRTPGLSSGGKRGMLHSHLPAHPNKRITHKGKGKGKGKGSNKH